MSLVVSNLGDSAPAVNRVTVNVGGVDHQVLGINPNSLPGNYHVQIFLAATVPIGASVPVTVALDGRASAPYALTIR